MSFDGGGITAKASAPVALTIALFVSMGGVAFGQTGAKPDRGVRPIGSYSVSDIENISLTNGNVNLSIPLAELPPMAGGRLSWVLRAIYNSKSWDVVGREFAANPPWPGYTESTVQLSDVAGWTLGGKYRIDVQTPDQDHVGLIPPDPDPEYTLLNQYRWKMILTTPDGAKHELRPTDYSPYPGNKDWARGYYKDTPRADSINATMRYYSLDGSYLWTTIQTYPVGGIPTKWDVYLPDGTRIKNRNGDQWNIDPNGNSIKIYTTTDGGGNTITHYRDEVTLREITFGYNPATNTTQVQYDRVGGGLPRVGIDVNFGTTRVHGVTYPIGDPCLIWELVDTDISVIRSIVLPETEPGLPRQQFTFSYNSDITDTLNPPVQRRLDCTPNYQTITTASHGWGSLSQMTTPQGASVNYYYQFDGTSQAVSAKKMPEEVITRKEVTHDGVTDTWTYNISSGGSGSVTGPDGSLTTESFYPHDPGYAHSVGGEKAGLVYRSNRSGKVIVERQWVLKQFSGGNKNAPGGTLGFNQIVTAEYTTLNDSAGNPTKMSAKTFQYDFNGQVTSETSYDWFDPSLVTRDAEGVPIAVPTSAIVLRTATNSYHNPATVSTSTNVYAKRATATATPLILSAVKESITGAARTRLSYDGLAYGTAPTKGNVTQEARWNNSNSTYINTTHTYDIYGNRISTTDPRGNVTSFVIDAATRAQPTSITVDPLNGTGQQTTTIAYDFSTGLVTSQTDPNGAVTTTDYTNQLTFAPDPYFRPGMVTGPAVTSTVGGVTYTNQRRKVISVYRDTARQVETRGDLNTEGDGLLKSRTTADQLGRTVLAETSENGSTYSVFTQSQYQQIGKITFTSNPYRSTAAATDGWTRTTADDIGRVVEVAAFSGTALPPTSGTNANWTGSVTTSYNAQETTVTDQASKSRRSQVDGLGRLVKVTEDPSGLNYQTTYGYDGLSNLTTVTQGSQTRSFTYDSLSRLKSATNPESGLVNYAYDDASNLTSKTDARGVVTTYGYDGLNRVTTRTYSDGTATVSYGYDSAAVLNSKGRLTRVSSTVSAYDYQEYDGLGRVKRGTQTTDGQAYQVTYGYDLAGNMTTETYPSGRVVTTNYDAASRLSSVTGQKSGELNKTYASSFTYSAHGAVLSMQLGNTKWEHTNFNSRLQPLQIGLGTSATNSGLLQLDYGYNSACQANNNGNVLTQTITIGATVMTQSYCYDALNRLQTASENTGASWSQTYGYDRYGNRWVSASTGYTLSSLTPQSQGALNAANNRLIASTYDFAGNQTVDAQSRTFTYDAENRQKTFNGTVGQYFYDGDGRRVKKIDGSGTTVFVYNAGGQLIAEYHNDPVPPPAGGGGTSYLTSDHLGSTRVVTKQDGTVKARYDYLPFGEELGATIGQRTTGMGYSLPDSTKQKFTQKERDTESGLDYFGARYYSSAQGRFTSVDPHNIILEAQATAEASPQKAKAQFLNYLAAPQQWNRYSYVANNPLVYVDPTGEILELTGSDEERKRAFERIKDVVGSRAAGSLYIREENGRYFVETNSGTALDASGKLGVVVNDVISSSTVVQFRVSSSSITENAAGKTVNLADSGGGYTGRFIGADGKSFIQVIVDVNADALATSGASRNGAVGDDGKPLRYFNDVADAHEFGHAYFYVKNLARFENAVSAWSFWKRGDTIGGLKGQSNRTSVDVENWARERRGSTNERSTNEGVLHRDILQNHADSDPNQSVCCWILWRAVPSNCSQSVWL